jgi:hypothetical protein
MDEIADQLARRDRVRRFRSRQKTAEERMAQMARMQEQAFALLRQNPEGYARFLRRNYKARSIRVSPPQEPHG